MHLLNLKEPEEYILLVIIGLEEMYWVDLKRMYHIPGIGGQNNSNQAEIYIKT